MRSLYLSLCVCVLLLRVPHLAADESVGPTGPVGPSGPTSPGGPSGPSGPIGGGPSPASTCPTVVVAKIPQGAGQFICVWQITDCGSGNSVGTINSDCDSASCTCTGGICSGTGPAYQRAPVAVVEIEGEGDPTENFSLYANLVVPQRTIPSATQLIPPAAASPIMTWGQGEWKVRYLKTLKLEIGPGDTEYHALYKIFKQTDTNSDGMTDADTDQYVGFRVSSEPAEPREVVTLNYNNSVEVKKLPLTTSGVRMEIGAKAPVNLTDDAGGAVTREKWFHVYGVYR